MRARFGNRSEAWTVGGKLAIRSFRSPSAHRALNHKRPGGSAIDARTTRHAGYALSQKKRKRIEESFGWLKTVALLRKVRHRGIFKVGWVFTFAAAAYNLVRMRTLGRMTVQSA